MKEEKKKINDILKKSAERENKFENLVLNLALKQIKGAYKDEAGVYYSKKKKHLLTASKALEGRYVIADGVQVIDDNAFWGCAYLEEVVIPSSVVEIGSEAFSRCISLKKLVIPKSVNLLGNNPFVDLSSDTIVSESDKFVIDNKMLLSSDRKTLYSYLTDASLAIIPKTVEEIRDLAFTRRRKLTKVEIPEGVKVIGSDAFSDCDALEEVIIPSTVETIENYAFAECDKLKTVTLKGNIRNLSPRTFADTERLHRIYVPKGFREKVIKQLHLSEENDDIVMEKFTNE
ncbi:leucine-rich repeat domain-containing protein [Prevotella brunnea]|uniref:Leucine-rich repeat domain-containing protein n=1 Tax=Prevotella brunnea TaxID=2508867 RepID=A0A5C8GKE0_9BACT|nr:leucine-rich repeat domain-containing protein [Prevotella brunnea]MDR0185739.1 leucine-rich repeat domain-containing protein [Prevotella brunnea]TXJ62588.1 leucine-rich repeat domain-containing protein [Prevotella brunnea]